MPGGGHLVTVEQTANGSGCSVTLIDISSGEKKQLTFPAPGVLADVEPAYSPDGKAVAFLRQSSASIAEIFVVSANGGAPHKVTADEREVRGFAWEADGKGFVVATRRGGNFLNLWHLPLDRGETVRLTEGPLNLGFPSVSKLSDRIAYVNYRDDINIWRSDEHGAQKWIDSRYTDWSPQYSPDGKRIAFVSDRAENLDIWLADADGRSPTRLTDLKQFPAGSPA